jgi:hypothetical protein
MPTVATYAVVVGWWVREPAAHFQGLSGVSARIAATIPGKSPRVRRSPGEAYREPFGSSRLGVCEKVVVLLGDLSAGADERPLR